MVDDGARESWTILVVEDDPQVREITCLLLEDLGYRAIGVASAESALRLVSRARAVPDLLIVDYRLGADMDGTELVGTLRERIGREIPALITSGDLRGGPSLKADEARCHFLAKPFVLKDLLGKLSEIGAATDAESRERARILPESTGVS